MGFQENKQCILKQFCYYKNAPFLKLTHQALLLSWINAFQIDLCTELFLILFVLFPACTGIWIISFLFWLFASVIYIYSGHPGPIISNLLSSNIKSLFIYYKHDQLTVHY